MDVERLIHIYRKVYTFDPWFQITESMNPGHVIICREGHCGEVTLESAINSARNDLRCRLGVEKINLERARDKAMILTMLYEEILAEVE